jgi:hypothetical protein
MIIPISSTKMGREIQMLGCWRRFVEFTFSNASWRFWIWFDLADGLGEQLHERLLCRGQGTRCPAMRI